MKLINRYSDWLLSDFHNPKAVRIFCKALVAYSILRLLLLWNVLTDISTYTPAEAPTGLMAKLVFLPSLLVEWDVSYFLMLCLAVWLTVFFLRWNYVLAILFFWLNLNLYRLDHSIVNGSDLVLVMLCLWAIGMERGSTDERGGFQCLVFNFAVLLTQLQLAFIYFLSGWDKLVTSSYWRSGEAFGFIQTFTFFNPYFDAFLSPEPVRLVLAWAIILFELGFGIGIWFKRTRKAFIIAGILFHLMIIVVLTLPDFGIVMILSYLIFLKDSDYDKIGLQLKRLRR